jgi:hypothetical protein
MSIKGTAMTTIQAHWIGGKAILPKQDFERLLELARKSEPVDIETVNEDLSAQAMMQLAENAGAFEFWNESGEELYSAKDGEPICCRLSRVATSY